MSLKLGNTSIAGTQVLYSTTGNNTDGAMTQATTTTQLNLKANDADAVHKTGNETISGIKTFNNAINLANNTWNSAGDDAYIGDHNIGGAFCIKGMNDNTKLILFNRNETVNLGFYIDESDNNALKLTNPTYSANAWGSITAMIAQNPNGYIKFNHGLIIQWGSASSYPVSFLTPFTMTPAVTGSPTYNGRTENGHGYVWNVTTTSFEYRCDGDMLPYKWIAIGY